ncbi:DUF4097 family beta strand repeat protein [candidate division KSB1 bacterium]|nr:DUF4097 family beta strand repeat protein [candidate division KSB1 bacterium]
MRRNDGLFIGIKAAIILFFLLPCFLFASDYEITETETHHFEISPNTLLELRLGSGNLNIATWGKPTIQILVRKWAKANNREKAESKLKELKIEFTLGNNKLFVHQLSRGSNNPFSSLLKFTGIKKTPSTKIDFELTVPKSIRLKIDKKDGSAIIEGIRGNITIEQKKGILEITNILAQNLELKLDEVQTKISNLNGQNGVDPHLSISIKQGEIVLDNSKLIRLVIKSKDADIYLVGNEIRSGEIETKSGDFFFNPNLKLKAKIRVRSDSGDMFLILPDFPESKIIAETALGVIRSAHQWEIKKSGGISILEYNGNKKNNEVCEFFSDIGDIFIQRKWQ